MPIIEVNGQEFDFPDSMSHDAIKGVLRQQFPMQSQDPMQQAFEAKKAGFLDRVSQDFQKRNQMVIDAENAQKRGEQGAAQTFIQGFGKGGVGFVNDVIGQGIVSAGRGLSAITPDVIENPIKEGASNVYNYISDSPAGDAARAVQESYSGFAKNNPNAARTLEGLANIGMAGSAFVPVKGISAANIIADTTGAVAKPLLNTTLNTTGKILEAGINKLAKPKTIIPDSEQITKMSKEAYAAARASGEMFDAHNVTNNFLDAINAAKPAKIANKVDTQLALDLESSLGKYNDLADKPLSIDEIDIIDKDLSNFKGQAYKAAKNQLASEYSNIQNALRSSVANAPSGQKLAEARNLFMRNFQMRDVESIFRNAEGRPNEAAIIQTGYRNLSNQARKKGSSYTKEQIKIMDKAAKGGLSIDALKLASSRLIPIAAGSMSGIGGAAAAYMGNLAAGAGATALQTAKANKLVNTIVKDLRVESDPTKINLAAQKLQKAFEAKKQGLQVTVRPSNKGK